MLLKKGIMLGLISSTTKPHVYFSSKSLSLSKTLFYGFRRKRQDLFLIVIIHWHKLSSQPKKKTGYCFITLHSKAQWKTNRQISDFCSRQSYEY